jgi:FAD:protein FMN transferase
MSLNFPKKWPDAMLAQNRLSDTPYQLSVGRRAMACQFEVIVNAGQPPHATEIAIQALDCITHLEQVLSVYIPDSEISRLNKLADQQLCKVSDNVFNLLKLALELHASTEGAFDVTAASLSEAWGFVRREGRMPSQLEIETALAQCGSQHIRLDEANRQVQFLRNGLRINTGGIGKGFAIDRAAAILRVGGVNDFCIHGGLSSVTAFGNRMDHAADDGWRIAVRHPTQPQFILGGVRLRNKSLGTSGPANQFFYFAGKRYGHIIDPRSGWPASGLLSTTVLTPNSATADALATGLYVLGLEGALRYCQSHPEVGLIALAPGQREGEIDVHTVNLSPGEWTDERPN